MKKLSAAFLTVLFVCALLCTGCGGTPPFFKEPDEIKNSEKPIGGDWRVWRGYTKDYKLSDSLTVTFSYFTGEKGEAKGCKCYAAYDASCGARMGTVIVDLQNSKKMTDDSGESFLTEDKNGDGIKDIGVSLTDGSVLWYDVVSGEWPEVGFPVFETIPPEAQK